MFLLLLNSWSCWKRHGKYENPLRVDVFILQAAICHLSLAAFLFAAFSFKFPVMWPLFCGCLTSLHGWERTVMVLCEALWETHGAPALQNRRCVSARLLFLSSCGNIMIEMLKTGLEIRHWWDRGDFCPFFSPLTGLHCGFVCGKPWFEASLTQTQPYPNVQPWSWNWIFTTSRTTTFARVAPLILPWLHVEPVSHTEQTSQTDSCVTPKGDWNNLRHHLWNISLNYGHFFLRIMVIFSPNTISSSSSPTTKDDLRSH